MLSPKRNNTSFFVHAFFVLGGVALFLLTFSYIRGFVYHFISPVTIKNEGYLFTSKRRDAEKIEALTTIINEKESALAKLALLEKENAELKELFGRSPSDPGILAAVIALPSQSLYSTLVLDAGSAEGVEAGMVVLAFDATELGVIDSVTEHRSVVILHSSPGRETSGTIVGSSNTTVKLIGRGGGEYEVRIPRDLVFDPGMLIITQSVFPKPLAQIKHISTDPRDPFQKILAKTPVNIENTRWVTIKKPVL
jgi:cell shape-determining protein MreC